MPSCCIEKRPGRLAQSQYVVAGSTRLGARQARLAGPLLTLMSFRLQCAPGSSRPADGIKASDMPPMLCRAERFRPSFALLVASVQSSYPRACIRSLFVCKTPSASTSYNVPTERSMSELSQISSCRRRSTTSHSTGLAAARLPSFQMVGWSFCPHLKRTSSPILPST